MICHNTYCNTEYAIYLMECAMCNLQYVGKNEASFNIKLNNHRKDVKDPKPILADKHFQQNSHRFNQDRTKKCLTQLSHYCFE